MYDVERGVYDGQWACMMLKGVGYDVPGFVYDGHWTCIMSN